MKTIFMAAAAIFLAACATEKVPDNVRQLPSFQTGYAHGCRSAQTNTGAFSGKVYRNEEAFEQDSAYRAGWREGYYNCGGRSPSMGDPLIDGNRVGPEPL